MMWSMICSTARHSQVAPAASTRSCVKEATDVSFQFIYLHSCNSGLVSISAMKLWRYDVLTAFPHPKKVGRWFALMS